MMATHSVRRDRAHGPPLLTGSADYPWAQVTSLHTISFAMAISTVYEIPGSLEICPLSPLETNYLLDNP